MTRIVTIAGSTNLGTTVFGSMFFDFVAQYFTNTFSFEGGMTRIIIIARSNILGTTMFGSIFSNIF